MQRNVTLRWLAEAEARQVCRLAYLHRAMQEPSLDAPLAPGNTPWADRLSRLIPKRARSGGAAEPCPGRSAITIPMPTGLLRYLRAPRTSASSERALATVLFTDIADSTGHAAALGDRCWRTLLDRHDETARRQIARFHGTEIKNLGDGFLATFPMPTTAIRCAAAITQAVKPLGLAMRSGLHTGEIELARNDIGGVAVHIAARIAAMAPSGQPLVSGTARDLAIGSGLIFEDHGKHVLRGLTEPIRLYALTGYIAPPER